MTEASRYLGALARQVAERYVAETGPRAILLTGSAAEGSSDYYSDLDLIAYHDQLPADEQVATARTSVAGGVAPSLLLLHRQEGSALEVYEIGGVEIQIVHLTVIAWERDMATVLEQFEPATNVQKAIMGLLDGVPLHGADLIESWQARAATYPDGLARVMVEQHLRFFPLWLTAERWPARDATLFVHQVLIEASLNLLAVLAGLNRLYFSSFQFKRLHHFAGKLRLAPDRLADRLDELLTLDPVAAGAELERLVSETVALVEEHMPEMDTAAVRQHLGARRHPWRPAPR